MTLTKLLGVGAIVALSLASTAQAKEGCGRGWHRNDRTGVCHQNRSGEFVAGQGWWDGHRYWHDRYRVGPGWRYR